MCVQTNPQSFGRLLSLLRRLSALSLCTTLVLNTGHLFSGIFVSGVLTFMISVINPNLNLIKFVTWDKLRYGVYRVACFPFAPRTLIQLSLFVGHTKPRTRVYA